MALHQSTRYSTTAAAASSIRRGGSNVDTMYSEERLYDLTAKVIEEKRTYAPLIHILTNKIGRTKANDPEPKFFIDSPFEGIITPTANQSDGGELTVTIGTTYINFINVGDIFAVNGIYFREESTLSASSWTATRGTANGDSNNIYAEEQILVTAVNLVAGSFTCKRGNGTIIDVSTDKCDITSNADIAIKTTTPLILMANAHEEGGSATVPYSVEIDQDQIYIQSSDEVYEMTNIQLGTIGIRGSGESLWVERRNKATERLLMKMERSIIWGQMAKISGTNPRRISGGMIEFIGNESGFMGDAQTKMLDFGGNAMRVTGSYTTGGMIDATEKMFNWGNAQKQKLCLCGQGNISMWSEMFVKYFVKNDSLTGLFGFDVTDFKSPHGTLHMLHEPVLTIANYASGTASQQLSNDMLIIDPAFVKLVYFTPLYHVDITPKDFKGRKHEAACDWGLWRAVPDAHSYCFNIARGN